jgi:hypothetical protein
MVRGWQPGNQFAKGHGAPKENTNAGKWIGPFGREPLEHIDSNLKSDLRIKLRKRRIRKGITMAHSNGIEKAKRVAKAVKLRQAGKTWPEIAIACGYSHASGAWTAVNNELLRYREENVERFQALKVERLEAMHAGIWDKATSGSHPDIEVAIKLNNEIEKVIVPVKPVRTETLNTNVTINASMTTEQLESELRELIDEENRCKERRRLLLQSVEGEIPIANNSVVIDVPATDDSSLSTDSDVSEKAHQHQTKNVRSNGSNGSSKPFPSGAEEE